jgi:hypothetical protein
MMSHAAPLAVTSRNTLKIFKLNFSGAWCRWSLVSGDAGRPELLQNPIIFAGIQIALFAAVEGYRSGKVGRCRLNPCLQVVTRVCKHAIRHHWSV